MQYLLTMTYRDGEGPHEGTPAYDAEMEVWGALNRELRASGEALGASGLKPDTATTVRTRDGEAVIVVAVNHAVAIGFAAGPEAGLAALPDDPRLAHYQPLHAARAELLRRAGDVTGADAALQTAIELSASEAEREALRRLGAAASEKPEPFR